MGGPEVQEEPTPTSFWVAGKGRKEVHFEILGQKV